MAEEMTTSPQTVPAEADSAPAAPEAAVPAAAPAAAPASAAPRKPKKDSPLLPVLTILLILVGIADAVLWGVVGYYLYQNAQRGDSSAPPQTALTDGTPAQSGSGDDASSDDDAKREALEEYIRQVREFAEVEQDMLNSRKSVTGTNYTDDATAYTEITERTTPLCQQLYDMVMEINPADPEISALHENYQDCAQKYLDTVALMSSALSNQDMTQVSEANDLMNETENLVQSYKRELKRLAEEWNVKMNF
ncbi:hypothetical protein [uncultured Oscillibacter sp.]|jgi:hypothetical protein|uniref:hypothetical protein n=1 Tax=uncultured Oscillibacter sp. TaxID=876091 RepID=UPI0025FF07E0|nr:hypothetical protein [uncultured Oscillibacter sp.]